MPLCIQKMPSSRLPKRFLLSSFLSANVRTKNASQYRPNTSSVTAQLPLCKQKNTIVTSSKRSSCNPFCAWLCAYKYATVPAAQTFPPVTLAICQCVNKKHRTGRLNVSFVMLTCLLYTHKKTIVTPAKRSFLNPTQPPLCTKTPSSRHQKSST
ncbi:hypothetical protein CLV59_104264 [Chitinophaga dinghuensis]|uniref:Uncharacterized protein n=1 Tax=Chitinophaga dinghuensis TaxID=1539050 RepID=A0A327VYJ4_9BACT|nr:hypothetical protein CLV59_104264 [Chitinophaga dinghuensis]